jgi:hypothetical protein
MTQADGTPIDSVPTILTGGVTFFYTAAPSTSAVVVTVQLSVSDGKGLSNSITTGTTTINVNVAGTTLNPPDPAFPQVRKSFGSSFSALPFAPTADIPTGLLLSIVTIAVREVSASGKTIKSFPIALSTISTVKTEVNGITSWNYSVPLSNGAYVLAAFTTVNQTTDINFSNKTFTLLPNVLKSSISVFQYPFSAFTNKLYIVFSLGSNTTSKYQVSNSDG